MKIQYIHQYICSHIIKIWVTLIIFLFGGYSYICAKEFIPIGSGTADDPYNVIAARTYTEYVFGYGKVTSDIYIKGKVLYIIDEFNTSDGTASFTICDDDSGDFPLHANKIFYLDNKKYTSDDRQIQAGDEVIICGKFICNPFFEALQYNAYVYSVNGNSNNTTKEVDGSTVTFRVKDAVDSNIITVDLNSQGWTNGQVVDSAIIKLDDGTKITFAKAEGRTTPTYYETTKGVRIYAKNTITISGKAVAKVVLNCDGYNGIAYTGNNSLYASINDTTFTICNEYTDDSGGMQLRVKSLEITYAKPIKTQLLFIGTSDNGTAIYDKMHIRNRWHMFCVKEDDSAIVKLSPDDGYCIDSVGVNGVDVTSHITNSQYSINNITEPTFIKAIFKEDLSITYTMSIRASGNGSASYNGTTIRNDSKSFTVEEGSSSTITFIPDEWHQLGNVKVNDTDVTTQLSDNQYTISNILANTSVSVTFADIEYDNLSNNGVNYRVVSNPKKTVSVANGSYGYWLTVPASFTANGFEWSVTGIDNDVITGNPQLAAVIWNSSTQFTASVDNPNFLLYVTSSQYAPSAIKNVVVGNTANSITLTDASSGNNFYCPREFTARSISYSHSYGMTTGISEARGWESISLPFDVEAITHSSKGTLVPFANWQEGGSTKPFWLYQLGSTGFAEANSIKANTPYIISMPNNAEYKDEYRVAGTITFSSTDVTVKSSESLENGSYSDRTFFPNFINHDANSGFYVLNAANSYVTNTSSYAEGSRFIKNLRAVRPFEAYIISENNARESLPIFEDTPTWIQLIENSKLIMDRVYNLSGQQVKIEGDQNYGSLKKGIYIVNGKKVVIK